MHLQEPAIVAYASDPHHPNIPLLRDGLRRWGWPELQLFVGPAAYRGHREKLRYLKEEAVPWCEFYGKTHLIALDCYDTLIGNSPEHTHLPAVLRHSLAHQGVLFSTELACWPDAALAGQFPVSEQHSDFKYLNSGGILGHVQTLKRLLSDYPIDAAEDDQLYWQRVYLDDDTGFVQIDSRCLLFQTTAHTGDDRLTRFFEADGGKIRNRQTGTLPAFWHSNGRTEDGWLKSILLPS